jgi:hypothetical protein
MKMSKKYELEVLSDTGDKLKLKCNSVELDDTGLFLVIFNDNKTEFIRTRSISYFSITEINDA